MTRKRLRSYTVFVVYGIALVLVFLACSGCSLLGPCPVDDPAADMVEEYLDARAPESEEGPAVSPNETRRLDKKADAVAEALDEKSRPMQFPTTGIPWVDGALGLATVASTIYASVKATNWSRDRKRKQRGEPVEVKKA